MKKLLNTAVIFMSICINASAQKQATQTVANEKYSSPLPPMDEEKTNGEKRGDKFYRVYSFDKAIDAYTHTKRLSVEGQRRLAESYHNRDKNAKAEIVYAKLINEQKSVLPDDYYNYAMTLKANNKYDESDKAMNKFKELKPNDLRARNYAANNSELTNLLKDDGKYKIVHMDVNTDERDFGTTYYKNKIVFSSSRSTHTIIARKYNWGNQPFLDMYVSEIGDEGQLKKPKIFDKGLNSKLHDGPVSFSKDGTLAAFTTNAHKVKSNDDIIKLQINFSSFKDGKWSDAEPFFLNNMEYSVGQPCLTADGNTMYFASDMPGGFGGADIYKITKDDKGQWGKPVNLGDKINTEGDEMFPFFEENNEILFFSSNGRLGLGGLDNFVCAVNGDKFGRVRNMGFPINTQADDFALIINDKFSKGYFSSNRSGGAGDDDIYSYDLLKGLDIGKKIQGLAKDKAGNIVPKTFITLLNDKGEIIDTLTTKEDGAFVFLVDSDKTFKLTGTKEKYIEGDSITNTFGKEFIVKVDVILDQKKQEVIPAPVVVETPQNIVGSELGNLYTLNPIYFDLNKYNIRPDAEIELNKIVAIMNEYPDMIVELGSYTDCRATMAYNMVLSNNRAKSSAAYIKKRITKPERIYGKGYGETKLVNGCACEGNVVSDCSEEEHQKNRRTEFIIIKK